jgi:hypothetical protein
LGLNQLSEDFNILSHKYYHINFTYLLVFLARFFDLSTTSFVGYCLTTILYYFAILLIMRNLSFKYEVIVLCLVLLLIWDSRGLESNTFWQNHYFESQFLAWPLALIGVAFSLKGKWMTTGLFCGLSGVMHFQIGLVCFAAIALSVIVVYGRSFFIPLLKMGAVFSVIFGLVVLEHYEVLARQGVIRKNFTIDYMRFRMPHHLYLKKSLFRNFLSMLVIAHIVYWILRMRKKAPSKDLQKHGFTLAIATVILLFCIIHDFDVNRFRVGTIVKVQFLRVSPLIHLFFVIYISSVVCFLARKDSVGLNLVGVGICFILAPWKLSDNFDEQNFLYLFAFLFAALFLVFYRITFEGPDWKPIWIIIVPPLILLIAISTLNFKEEELGIRRLRVRIEPAPWPREWVSLCDWISKNTEEDALFITPPYKSGFTYHAKRAMVAEFKINPHVESQALEWLGRLEDLSDTSDLLKKCRGWGKCPELLKKGYTHLSPQQIAAIARKYDASYFVAENDPKYPFQHIKGNEKFSLYRLNDVTPPSSLDAF